MKERPILFSRDMVRAILEGRKTQTRRVMKVQPAEVTWWWHGQESDARKGLPTMREANGKGWAMCGPFKCPYIANGMFASMAGELMPSTMNGPVIPSRLWVRETWSTHACFDDIKPSELKARSIHYWADGEAETGKKRPSIFMPRNFSRILLEITNVRVERLMSISKKDAIAEGCSGGHGSIPNYGYSAQPQEQYFWLWDQINGKGSYMENPFVWVITFKVVEIKR